MKTVVILQPSYLPWLGYFDQMARADHFVYYDDVPFDKHGWRNRNRIKSPSCSPHWLTVPVLHAGRNQPLLKDIEIDKRRDWARKHVGTVRQFYAEAPFLHRYIDEFAGLLETSSSKLAMLNVRVISWMCDQLRIHPQIHRSSELGIEGDQTVRLVNICRHFEATHYLSGNAAKDYLDVEAFSSAGIEVVWQDYIHPTYSQLHGDFLPYLSALDLLLNMGPESHKYFAPL